MNDFGERNESSIFPFFFRILETNWYEGCKNVFKKKKQDE